MNKTPCQQRACELVDYLQVVMGEAKGTDKKTPGVCEILSSQEIQVLLTVGRRGPCAMSQIADAIQLSFSSVTSVVDKLVEKGVLQRGRSVEDRRLVTAEVTEEGKRLYVTARDGHIRFAHSMLSALDSGEQELLVKLFKKVATAIQEAKKAAA
ncbi:MAG TPA: MarR family transcriptional regulator [Elusimicrobiota bacterium]|jgi:MarR family 2-MHQ and catechol resistance regulon transcriptional repressor|nr:MarR family transcriptional regulator [Elusimicrobiota bacterium]